MTEKWFRLAISLTLIGMLCLLRGFEAPIRGFWCDDQTIRYPHLPMIVDYRLLLAVSIVLPLLLFWILPVIRKTSAKSHENGSSSQILAYTDTYLASIGPEFPGWDYMFGFLVNLVLTTYCKLLIGRPRPNFHAICQPTVTCEMNEKRFISNFSCTTEKFLSRNSMESFFSGHSSTGTYAALFMAMHLAAHWRNVNYSIKALVCSTLIGFGLFPGFTQV